MGMKASKPSISPRWPTSWPGSTPAAAFPSHVLRQQRQQPGARTRPQALRRAVTNLIENALHYAGHPPELAVGMLDGRPMIEVLDRGPGIPAAQTEKVKRPFTRLESARSNTKGSGTRAGHR
jgi:signal transduction histidine kinase